MPLSHDSFSANTQRGPAFNPTRQAPQHSVDPPGGWDYESSEGGASDQLGRGGGMGGERGPLPATPTRPTAAGVGWEQAGNCSRWVEGESLRGSVVGGETASIATVDKLQAYGRVSGAVAQCVGWLWSLQGGSDASQMSQGDLLAMLAVNNEKQGKWMEENSRHQRQMDDFFRGLTDVSRLPLQGSDSSPTDRCWPLFDSSSWPKAVREARSSTSDSSPQWRAR